MRRRLPPRRLEAAIARKAATLKLVLRDAKGRTVASWSEKLKAGTTTL